MLRKICECEEQDNDFHSLCKKSDPKSTALDCQVNLALSQVVQGNPTLTQVMMKSKLAELEFN